MTAVEARAVSAGCLALLATRCPPAQRSVTAAIDPRRADPGGMATHSATGTAVCRRWRHRNRPSSGRPPVASPSSTPATATSATRPPAPRRRRHSRRARARRTRRRRPDHTLYIADSHRRALVIDISHCQVHDVSGCGQAPPDPVTGDRRLPRHLGWHDRHDLYDLRRGPEARASRAWPSSTPRPATRVDRSDCGVGAIFGPIAGWTWTARVTASS